MNDEYKKYLKTPYKKNKSRHCMSNEERAGQFMPFSALVGFEDKIAEQSRVYIKKVELSEDEKEMLDKSLKEILECINTSPEIFVRYFSYDVEKKNGQYFTKIGKVYKYDEIRKKLFFTDMCSIDLEDIVELEKM